MLEFTPEVRKKPSRIFLIKPKLTISRLKQIIPGRKINPADQTMENQEITTGIPSFLSSALALLIQLLLIRVCNCGLGHLQLKIGVKFYRRADFHC